jgi:hypothetical protein
MANVAASTSHDPPDAGRRGSWSAILAMRMIVEKRREPPARHSSRPVAYGVRMRSRLGAAALACLVGLVAASCGGGGEQGREESPGAAEQLLTRADVEAQPSGSPEEALFRWWRAAQYSDLHEYLAAYEQDLADRLRITGEARRELRRFAEAIRTARPEVVETRVDVNRATVYTMVRFRQPIGLTRYISTGRPQAFTMIREDGRWVLENDFFVDILVDVAADYREEEG